MFRLLTFVKSTPGKRELSGELEPLDNKLVNEFVPPPDNKLLIGDFELPLGKKFFKFEPLFGIMLLSGELELPPGKKLFKLDFTSPIFLKLLKLEAFIDDDNILFIFIYECL